MGNSREKNDIAIKNEWEKMISGQLLDKDNVSPMVYESWQRSL